MMRAMIFVLGHQRSGSTLLDAYLGAQSGVIGTGEFHRVGKDPANVICADGQAVADSPFWRPGIEAYVENFGLSPTQWFDERPLYSADVGRVERAAGFALAGLGGLGREFGRVVNRSVQVGHNALDFADGLAAAHSSEVVVDSTKSPSKLAAYLSSRPRTVRVVNLVRDSRAVAVSLAARGIAEPAEAADMWVHGLRSTRHVLRLVPPSRRVDVRYEDFCRAPEVTLRRILQTAELHPPTIQLSDIRPSMHQIPGSDWLLAGSEPEIREDSRWQDPEWREVADLVEAKTGKYLERLGYL